MNVRDASHKQILDNDEVSNLIKIMGFFIGHHYDKSDDLSSLRYGSIMLMTD